MDHKYVFKFNEAILGYSRSLSGQQYKPLMKKINDSLIWLDSNLEHNADYRFAGRMPGGFYEGLHLVWEFIIFKYEEDLIAFKLVTGL